MQRKMMLITAMLVLAGLLGGVTVFAQGPTPGPRAPMSSAFTYQGQLKSSGNPYTGSCDFQFGLYDAATLGSRIGLTQTVPSVSMASGLFTTPIDFGAGAFNGDARHLQIGVRCPAGVGSFTSLTTRQDLTAAPYALYATNAGSAATLTGVLPTANGGTGLSSSGVAGRYLRSNGSIWTSSAIQVGDLPAGSAYYIQNSTLQQASANFNISGSGTLGGALNLPNTTSSSVGVINLGTNRFLHNKGFQNTFLGSFAGNLATTGTGNTAVGYTTLTYNTEGNSNAALGANALSSNTSGSNNTALGYAALNANDTGSENTGVGRNALFANSTGSYNAALGASALTANITGFSNVALGAETLTANTSGAQNTAVGGAALGANTTGADNIGVGAYALSQLTGGYVNIALGSSAGYSYTGTESYNIVIGNSGTAGDSNTIRIGATGIHTKTVIAGIHGATSTSGTTVYVNSNGQLGTVSSSQRFKDNIRAMGSTSDILYQLRPVNFTYKPEYGGSPDQLQVGLIAEQVAQVAPWMVVNDKDGQPYTVRYELLAPMLVNELQKQQGTIQKQADENADLRSQVADLDTQVATMQQENADLRKQVASTASRLDALETALAQGGPAPASTGRGVSQNGLDGLSTPVWVLVGMVGLLVGQRAWRGGKA